MPRALRMSGAWRWMGCAAALLIAVAAIAEEAHPRYRGTIIVSIAGDPTQAGGYTAVIRAYRKVQPDVQVKLELKGAGFAGVGGYPTWLNTQLASGQPRPDIVSGCYSLSYGRYVDLDYYRYGINPHTGRRWEEDVDFDFCVVRNTVGQRIQLATQAVHIMWFYNKDLFARLGLAPPRTWPEFMETCRRVKAAKTIPTTLRFDFRYQQWMAEILWDQYSRPQYKYMRALPGDWNFNPNTDSGWTYRPEDPFNDLLPTINLARFYRALRDGDIRYDTAEFRQFLSNMKEIAQYTPKDFLLESGGAGGDAYSLFLRQQAAMHLDGSWLLPQIEKDMAELGSRAPSSQEGGPLRRFEWGTFDPPSQVDPLVKAPARSIESAGGDYISVLYKDQKQVDMVMDFVMFWLSRPGYQAFVDGQVAANEFLPAGRVVIRDVCIPEQFREMLKDVQPAGNAETVLNQVFQLPPVGSRLIQDGRQILVDLLQDRIGADEAANRVQRMAEAAVKERMERSNLPPSLLDHPEADPSRYQ